MNVLKCISLRRYKFSSVLLGTSCLFSTTTIAAPFDFLTKNKETDKTSKSELTFRQQEYSIKRVFIKGVSQLSQPQINNFKKTVPPHLSASSSSRILQQIKNMYQEKGLPTPVVSLSISKLTRGTLSVTVTEVPTNIFIKEKKLEQPSPPPAFWGDSLMADVLVISKPIPKKPKKKKVLAKKKPAPIIFKSKPKTMHSSIQILPTPPPMFMLPITIASTLVTEPAPVGDFYEGWDSSSPQNFDVKTSYFNQDDELLLELRLDGHRKVELFSAYQDIDGKVWMPLSILMGAVGFPITVNPATGTANGWFMQKARTLLLDMGKKVLEIQKESLVFPKANIVKTKEDIFITTDELEKWFPLKFDLSFNDLSLYISSTETLPNQAKYERQRIWEQREKQVHSYNSNIPMAILPYQNASLPLFKLDTSTGFNRSGGNSKETAYGNAALQAQTNILKMSMQTGFGINYNTNKKSADITTSHLTLNKYSPNKKLLGPLKASQVELGDISLPNIPLVPNSLTGRGTKFSNQPIGFIEEANLFTVEGDGPAGWDVEVYQDKNLLAFKTLEEDGHYIFDTLALKPGLNLFKIVLYGPQGEREERTEKFFMGANMVKKGQFYYSAGVTESSAPTLDILDDKGGADGSSILRMDYGLNKNLSLTGGLSKGDINETETTSAVLGLKTAYNRYYMQSHIARLGKQGYGWQINGASRLPNNWDIAANVAGQTGDILILDGDTRRSVKIDAGQQIGFPSPFSYKVSYEHELIKKQENKHTLSSFQKWYLWNTAFSHNIEHSWQGEISSTDGSFDFSAFMSGLPVRGAFSYNIDYEKLIKAAEIGTRFKIYGNFLNLTTNHTFSNNLTTLNGNMVLDTGKNAIKLKAGIGSDHSFNVGWGMTFNFAPTSPLSIKYKLQEKNTGLGFGTVALRAFVDENNNGTFDLNEKTVADVSFNNRRTGRHAKTDKNGLAMLYDLVPMMPIEVKLEEDSLPDIYLKAPAASKLIVAHAGFSGTVDFPLQRFGEISGILSVIDGDNLRPLSNIPLELRDSNDKIIDEQFSEYDGFYIFPAIAMGKYTIHIPSEYAENLGFNMNTPIKVTLTHKKPEVSTIDITLEQEDFLETETPIESSTTIIY